MRILFVTATRIGDAILSTGLLSHLTDRYPEARITIASGPVVSPLFMAVPGLERVIELRKRRFSLHWLELWQQCVPQRWDIVIDLRRSALSWLLFARDRRLPPPANLDVHRVTHLAATHGLENSPPAPTCWTQPQDDSNADQLIPEGAPVLAVAAAANWPGKQWRPERFVELIGRLTGHDGVLPHSRVAILGTAQELGQVKPLLESIPPEGLLNLVGKTTLPVAAAALRRCALFIGNDSGLMHMSAAVGIPTLGLFGPSHPYHYAPWGDLTAYVRTDASYDELVSAPGYDHRNTGTVMDSLSVDKAEASARDLWRRVKASADQPARRQT